MAPTLANVDIAFLSAPRLAEEDCAALARRCAARGPSTVVVTRGTAGAVGLADGRVLIQAVVPTQVVDTLGAGDGFIAGFLVAHLNRANLATALLGGATMAARGCTWRGAFGHASPWSAASHE